MIALIQAVRDAIRDGLAYVRESDVYITPHVNIIPAHAGYPCIGVKDGDIESEELPSEMIDQRLNVEIVIYQRFYKDEVAIVGNASEKGVLEIENDIHAILDDNDLMLPGIQGAFCPKSKGSESFGGDDGYLQRKIIVYRFEREKERP